MFETDAIFEIKVKFKFLKRLNSELVRGTKMGQISQEVRLLCTYLRAKNSNGGYIWRIYGRVKICMISKSFINFCIQDNASEWECRKLLYETFMSDSLSTSVSFYLKEYSESMDDFNLPIAVSWAGWSAGNVWKLNNAEYTEKFGISGWI